MYIVPGRELLECLVLVAGEELRGGAESAGAGGQSDRGLHPGADQWSTNEAGRADGARRDTEDGKRRHVGSEGLAESKGGEGRVDGAGKGGRSHVPGWILRVVWCLRLRPHYHNLSHHPMWPV